MAHLYSRGCEYALRALQAMALDPGQPATVTDLCNRAQVPEHFTRKMLQPLVKAGILKSMRGPGGGFSFTREPCDIALIDVVAAIESGPRFDLCILGRNRCEDKNPCPLHHLWAPIKAAALSMLRNRSVADLAGNGSNGNGNGSKAALGGERQPMVESALERADALAGRVLSALNGRVTPVNYPKGTPVPEKVAPEVDRR